MRVPRGLPWGVISTAAFSSKRMWLPSGRPYSLAVRTITARTTSPFFTPELGRACLTLATITSPTSAESALERPTMVMHCSVLAPVLSATRRRVYWRIISAHQLLVRATRNDLDDLPPLLA